MWWADRVRWIRARVAAPSPTRQLIPSGGHEPCAWATQSGDAWLWGLRQPQHHPETCECAARPSMPRGKHIRIKSQVTYAPSLMDTRSDQTRESRFCSTCRWLGLGPARKTLDARACNAHPSPLGRRGFAVLRGTSLALSPAQPLSRRHATKWRRARLRLYTFEHLLLIALTGAFGGPVFPTG